VVSPANSYSSLPFSGSEYGYFPAVAILSAFANRTEDEREEIATVISKILDICINPILKKTFEMATGLGADPECQTGSLKPTGEAESNLNPMSKLVLLIL
jgi:hypothetical protein